MNYGQHYRDEDLYMYYRMELTIIKSEYILGQIHIDPKTMNSEIPPKTTELNDINNALERSVGFRVDKKTMKTNLTTGFEIIFKVEWYEILGFTKKKHIA